MSDSDSDPVGDSEADPMEPEEAAATPSKRWLRRVLLTVVVLLAVPILVIAVLLLFPIQISLEKWSDQIDQALTEFIGREVAIEDGVVLVTGVTPSIEVRGLAIQNPEGWKGPTQFAHLERFRTSLGLQELFQQVIAIDDITIQGLTLHLEESDDGAGNWEGLAPSIGGTEAGPTGVEYPANVPPGFDLASTGFGKVLIEDLRIIKQKEKDSEEGTLLLKRLEGTAPAGGAITFRIDGEIAGLPFQGTFLGGSLPSLLERKEEWPIELNGHLGQSKFEISGNMAANEFETPGVLNFEVEIPEIEELFPFTGDLPPIGSLQASGTAKRTSEHEFALPELKGSLGESPLEGSATLDLSDDIPLVDGSLSIDFVHLENFRQNVSATATPDPSDGSSSSSRADLQEARSHPFFGSLHLKVGEIRGIDTPATVRDLDFRASLSEGLVTAELTTVFADMDLNGRMDIRKDEKDRILFALALNGGEAELTEMAAHYLNHEKFTGRFQSIQYSIRGLGPDLEGAWKQRDVHLEVSDADVSYPLFGETYRFFVETGTLNHSSGPSAVVELDGAFRDEPFDIQLDVVRTEESAGSQVRISHAVGQFADIELELSDELLSQPFTTEEARLTFSIKGERLDKLDHIYELNLPPLGPYSASGIYRHTSELVAFDEFKVAIGSIKLAGNCLVEGGEKRPKLTLDLSSPLFQLEDFGAADWSPVESSEANGPASTNEPGIVDLLSHEALGRVDAEIKLDLGSVRSGRDLLGRGSVNAILQDARLTLNPLVLGIPGGDFKGSGIYHPKAGGSLDWQLDLSAGNFDVGVIARRYDPDTVFRGLANADLALEASGVPYGLPRLKDATGKLAIDFCPENLDSGSLDIWVKNLVLLLLPRLDPKNQSQVNCIIGRLNLDDGLITTETLGMDTTTMRVAAEGQIDLAEETIELKLSPVPKRPQLFSLQVPVGIKGSLDQPEFVMGKRPALRALAHLTKNTLLFPATFLLGERPPADGSDICPCRREN